MAGITKLDSSNKTQTNPPTDEPKIKASHGISSAEKQKVAEIARKELHISKWQPCLPSWEYPITDNSPFLR